MHKKETHLIFSERLKSARKMSGLTQLQLANIVHTKKTTISNYETGYSTPSNSMIVDLANHLNVSTDFLLGRIDSPSHDSQTHSSARSDATQLLWDDLKNLDEDDVLLLSTLVQRMKKEKEPNC